MQSSLRAACVAAPDAVTLQEEIYRPTQTTNRFPFVGQALITFAGVAKTFAMQFHNQNNGDVAAVAYAYMDFWRVA